MRTYLIALTQLLKDLLTFWKSNSKGAQNPKKFEVICAWCGLFKGHCGLKFNTSEIWPEPWAPGRIFIPKESKRWQTASHGICPECYEKIIKKGLAA